jgi:hypothetical protein
MSLPARIAALSGANGDNPAAIKSTLMNSGQPASFGRNSWAKVVFPAPFGPAMMMILQFKVVSPFGRQLSAISNQPGLRLDWGATAGRGFVLTADC